MSLDSSTMNVAQSLFGNATDLLKSSAGGRHGGSGPRRVGLYERHHRRGRSDEVSIRAGVPRDHRTDRGGQPDTAVIAAE